MLKLKGSIGGEEAHSTIRLLGPATETRQSSVTQRLHKLSVWPRALSVTQNTLHFCSRTSDFFFPFILLQIFEE